LLLPANRAPEAISQLLSGNDGQPRWLSTIMNGLSRVADQRGTEISIVLAVCCAGVAVAMLSRPLARLAVIAAATLGIVFWIAQGLGGIFTGHGTDPNSGPLLILLAVCYLPRRTRRVTLEAS
jgi:hypothetical protein